MATLAVVGMASAVIGDDASAKVGEANRAAPVSTSSSTRPRLLERMTAPQSAQDPNTPAFCFVANPTAEQMAEIMQRFNALPPSMFMGLHPRFFSDSPVWVGNGLQGSNGQAARANLTYSFPNDGVSWGSSPVGPNDLNAKLKTLFGAANLDEGREMIRQALASWRRFNGLTYSEVADDNIPFTFDTSHTPSRGDVRIGSNPQGTSSGVLAYDFFPSGGADMTLNSDQFLFNTLGNSLNNYRYLRNVVSHEHGHGLGFIHPTPCNGTKIMEPFINVGFDGIQLDEMRGAGFDYGDKYSGNSSAANAADFGNLTTPIVRSVIERNLSTNGIAGPNGTGADWFRFTIDSAQNLVITATPTGGSYQAGQQSSGCQPDPAPVVNAQQAGNLVVELRNGANGSSIVQSASSAVAGSPETVTANALAAGTYWVRVYDSGPNVLQSVQIYDLTLRVGTSNARPVAIAGVSKRVQADTNCFFIGDANSFATESGATITGYVWDRDGDGTFETNIANPGVSPTFQYVSNGVYDVTLRVTDSNGLTATDTIQVTVSGANAAINSISPNSSSVNVTLPVTITGKNLKGVANASQVTVSGQGVTVIGTPSVNKMGTQITGLSLLIASNAGAGTRSISVTNSDGSGSGSASGAATGTGIFNLTGTCIAPAITASPSPQTACLGASPSLSVTATGTALVYQWRKGASPIAGANSATLTIPSAAMSDAGNYDCVVTGACGNATSNQATLTVDPAQITTQPNPVTRCSGGTAIFSIGVAGGTGFQWRKNGLDIPTAHFLDLIISPVSLSDIGLYDCVVTVPCGTLTSNAVPLNVATTPSVIGQPSPLSVCAGGSATFVVAGSGASLTYQWLKDGAYFFGETSASLTINPVSGSDAASYSCIVGNSCGSVASSPATLTITPAVTITGSPSPQSACEGGSAMFSVTVSGTPSGYQWRKGTVNIQGADGPTLTFNPVAQGDAGSYDCVVSSACGDATSGAATLTVNTPVSIGTHPSPVTVCSGGSAVFSVAATGTSPTYQWRKGATNIPGATGPSLTINPVTSNDAASYDCVVGGACGGGTSNAASLTVNTPVSIDTHPSAQTVCTGGSATFTVSATGTSLGFQWRKGTDNISGATTPSLTINPVSESDAGNYNCVVTGACGGLASNFASLTVNSTVSISGHPSAQMACEGGSATFTVTVTGTPTGYQWRKGAVNIQGATGSTLTFDPVTPGDVGSYDCIVSSACGDVPTNAASLTVSTPVSITGHPSGQSVCEGGSVMLSVGVSGASPIYQWRKDTNAIQDATGPSLTINPAAASDAGSYDCVVGGTCGGATSNPAIVVVCTAITINTSPTGLTTCPGESVTLNVSATGSPLSYQWRKGIVNIPGATAAGYTFTTSFAADVGLYDCVVGNCCQSVPSGSALVKLCKADYNCTHSVNVADIFAFLSGWFAGDLRADNNEDTHITVADIFAFLSGWFAGC